jgi:hypothetical protein
MDLMKREIVAGRGFEVPESLRMFEKYLIMPLTLEDPLKSPHHRAATLEKKGILNSEAPFLR